MPKPRKSYVDGPFGQAHYRIIEPPAADRRPLYCLHQSPKSGLEFEAFMQAMDDRRVIVAPDYPGYGMSDPPPLQSAATIEAYAESVFAIADALGHFRIDLFGNHTGGKVAAAMARERPERVGAVVMVSAALTTAEERRALEAYFTPIPLDREGTRFRVSWARIVEHSDPALSLETLAVSFAQNLMAGEAYEWGHAAAFAWSAPFEEALRTLDCPIAIINPDDQLTLATRRASSLMRNGRVIERPDWRHGFLDADPAGVAALVTSFLDTA